MADNNRTNSDPPIQIQDIKDYIWSLFGEFLDLDKGVNPAATIEEIKQKETMSGANAWMLMCSIMIASIGLNLNSQAVIIGAMLISPLMSPVLGIGLSVGINDKDGLYRALKHFSAAAIIAVFTSYVYFAISPLDEFTEQISARTEPTFLDIFIAIFGGIAGIISVARKDISTTLPGVAIATALMPPLCVTGYGIANGSLRIASTSFYLFFLNSFFVAFATYLIVRYLKFPNKAFTSIKERRKNVLIVSFISFIMTIPSIFIFSDVYKKYKQKERINTFISTEIGDQEIYLDDYELVQLDDDTQELILKVYGDIISRDKIPQYEASLEKLGLKNTIVEIIPTSEINLEKIRQLEKELSDVGARINSHITEINKTRQLNSDNDKHSHIHLDDGQLLKEIQIFLPEVTAINLVDDESLEGSASDVVPLLLLEVDKAGLDEEKLYRFLITRLDLDTIQLQIK